ncbi:MAG: peptidoglycan editing factor PgeF [Thermodesulfovibrionales bacterium]|nr:peptidoglycan editing factor PgeF [Thermodesulfovibrionales bacterium]
MNKEIKTKDYFIFPDIFNDYPVKAFFTKKEINGDLTIISNFFKIPLTSIYQPIQRHTDKVFYLNGLPKKVIADAVITKKTELLLGVDVADCVPILIFDRKNKAIGAIHSGWRGTSQQILRKTIGYLREIFSTDPLDILIAFGPSIRKCCYEVSDDVYEAIKISSEGWQSYIKKNEKYFIDLSHANIAQALSEGVPSKNIWDCGLCTFCNPSLFYSYRFSKGKTGKQSGFIGLF